MKIQPNSNHHFIKKELEFLNNIENYGENEIMERVKNPISLTHIFLTEFKNKEQQMVLLFKLFKKEKTIFNIFYKTFSESLKIESSQNLVENILYSSNSFLKDPNNSEEYYQFLISFENFDSKFSLDKHKKEISTSAATVIYEAFLKDGKLLYTKNESLQNFLATSFSENFNLFLKYQADVYLEYCEKTNTLGFGSCFNIFDNEFHTYIDIIKENFKNHPKYNEIEWTFKIFEDQDFQNNIDSFNLIPDNIKHFIYNTLKENPTFLKRKLTWGEEGNLEELREHLKKTKIKELLDVVEQIENEKKIKTEVIPNISKKVLKQSRF